MTLVITIFSSLFIIAYAEPITTSWTDTCSNTPIKNGGVKTTCCREDKGADGKITKSPCRSECRNKDGATILCPRIAQTFNPDATGSADAGILIDRGTTVKNNDTNNTPSDNHQK